MGSEISTYIQDAVKNGLSTATAKKYLLDVAEYFIRNKLTTDF